MSMPQAAAPVRPEFETNIVLETLGQLGTMFIAALPYVVLGIIVVVVFLLIGRVVRKVIRAAGRRTRLDLTLAELLGRLASFAIALLGFLIAAVIVFPTFNPGDLVAGLGLTSVALGFAFKDVLQNFFAGLLILWRRPFVVGDQIKVKGYEGTVEEINVRSTRIKTYDGERAIIPNADAYTNPILVRSAYDRRRVRFTVGIGYPDSIEEARATIHRVLDDIDGVLDDPGPWVYVSELAPSSVNFNVYFWVHSDQATLLRVSDRVATEVKLALDRVGIDMPYPHRVVLFNNQTGSRIGDIGKADVDGAHPAREKSR